MIPQDIVGTAPYAACKTLEYRKRGAEHERDVQQKGQPQAEGVVARAREQGLQRLRAVRFDQFLELTDDFALCRFGAEEIACRGDRENQDRRDREQRVERQRRALAAGPMVDSCVEGPGEDRAQAAGPVGMSFTGVRRSARTKKNSDRPVLPELFGALAYRAAGRDHRLVIRGFDGRIFRLPLNFDAPWPLSVITSTLSVGADSQAKATRPGCCQCVRCCVRPRCRVYLMRTGGDHTDPDV